MAFLTIAGIDVSVTAMSEQEPILVGDEGRSYNGTLRGNIDAEKRRWNGTGLEVSRADFETLRAAVELGAHVAVTGDALPGTPRTMRVRLSGGEYVRDGTDYLVVPTFAMEDV